MSKELYLKEFQIALLELEEANLDPDSIHIPGYIRRGGWAVPYVERERHRKKSRKKWLRQQIKYLRTEHYIEKTRANEQNLYRLTAKGKYELLRIRFMQHMEAQKTKPWDRCWRVIIFDIPEQLRKHRDHLRKLLKASGFQMWQFSVWFAKYNPEPALYDLLKYLDLHKYYAIIEADCKKCSPRLVKKWRQMQRQKEQEDLSPSQIYFKAKKAKKI